MTGSAMSTSSTRRAKQAAATEVEEEPEDDRENDRINPANKDKHFQEVGDGTLYIFLLLCLSSCNLVKLGCLYRYNDNSRFGGRWRI